MYSTEFGKKHKNVELNYEIKDKRKIVALAPIIWAEHCVECAAPLCYGTCPKFRRRKDGRCQLFKNSISSLKDNKSLYGESINVEFEGWAKLEADVNFEKCSIKNIQQLNRRLKNLSNLGVFASSTLEGKKKEWWITNKIYNYKEKKIRSFNKKFEKPDAFFLGAILNEKKSISIMIEMKKLNNEIVYRNAIELKPGYNEHIIEFDSFGINYDCEYKIYIYSNNLNFNVTFTMLDFVWFEKNNKEKGKKKIKCIAWDLDNTLWDGVFIEGSVTLKKDIKKIIKSIDERGIINSIISKNDKEEVMKFLEKEKIAEYFVMPQINWDPKSVNIERLAKQMNIGIDAIAFIDDNPFEREEVESVHPSVTIYEDTEYLNLLDKPEFQVIVTDDTKKRRSTYKMLEKQNEEWEKFEGNIDEFLKQCKMKVTFRKPTENEYDRCYELLQRTNQLNSSGRRLTMEELLEYINSETCECYILQVEDKFGSYGIVGFSIVDVKNIPTITDFVISCRVANKKVENTYILYLANKYKENGSKKLRMNYVKTAKNGPIFKVVEDLKLKEIKKEDDKSVYELSLEKDVKQLNIMEIID